MDDRWLLTTSRAREKTANAIGALAAGKGGLTERLTKACLELAILDGRDLPEPFLETFKSIHERMTAHPAQLRGEGTIHATIRNMHHTAARRLAKDIVSFTLDVHTVVGG